MNNKDNILIISKSIGLGGPQGIRFFNFIYQWVNTYNIFLLTKDKYDLKLQDIFVRYSELNIFGKLLIGSSSNSPTITNGQQGSFLGIKNYIKNLGKRIKFRKFFFPDIYSIEYLNTKRELKKLLKEYEFKTIIVSAFPFTFLALAKVIKTYYPSSKIIYDTGDPFYLNKSRSSIGLLHKLFSRKYEAYFFKYLDYLVVPNYFLRNHFLKYYSSMLSPNKVEVIEQGINKFADQKKKTSDKNGLIVLVYAGRFYHKLREPFELYKAINEYPNSMLELKLFGQITPDMMPPNNKNIRYMGNVSQEDVIKEYLQSDIIVFLDNFDGIQIPGKIFEVISLQMPILFIYSNENSPALQMIQSFESVFYCTNTAESIQIAINKIVGSKNTSYSNFDFSKFHWSNLSKKYLEII